jgi:hypothetical protein
MKAHGLPKTTTNLDQLGVSAKVIQQILRHGNVATTMIYIKPGVAEASTAMKKLEGLCATIVQPQSSSGAPADVRARAHCLL